MNENNIKVYTVNTLLELPSEPAYGDIYYINTLEQAMVYKGEWITIENSTCKDTSLSMNLYDLNKSIMSQLDPLSDEALNKYIQTINDWAAKQPDTFFMLLSNDIHYYTIFRGRNKKNLEFQGLGQAVITCLKEIAPIHDITLTDNGIEIWANYEDDMTYFSLFPYDRGIVDYRR